MSKKKRLTEIQNTGVGKAGRTLDQTKRNGSGGSKTQWKRRIFYGLICLVVVGTLLVGVMAKNGWLPRTDPLSGQKTGWFGRDLPRNASSSWNPLAAPLPTPTPQLSKEYIYAGSRLLAVEDANANAAPPADLAIWRPSTGTWWVLGGQGSQQIAVQWGISTDKPVPGDYDGDGKTDFSVFRPGEGNWYIQRSSDNAMNVYTFGLSGDKLAPGDYDGDGRTDAAVFRNGIWYVLRSSDGGVTTQEFGLSSDTPAVGDYDGDGKADFAVWRSGSPATFYILRSNSGQLQTAQFGQTGDVPVSGDYDGDGRSDFALRSGANWTFLYSGNGQTQIISWQQSEDQAVQNDYDGDGKVDIAVWRESNGTWYIRNSSTGQLRQQQWGMTGDFPVPAFYRR